MPLDFNDIILHKDMRDIYSSTFNCDRFKNSSIFISGATGMLASYLVLYFIWLKYEKKYNIKLYLGVRSENKARSRFGNYIDDFNIKLIIGDICDDVDLPNNIDYIIHAASLASPQYYGGNPVETMLPNIVGTYNLLKYAKSHLIKSFVFFSSGAVYGKFDKIDCFNESMSGEFDFLDSGSVYGESKRCGEALCNAYFREYNIPVKSVRIYHTYGPSMDIDKDKRAFCEFTKNIVDNQNIKLKSDGSAKRPFCYITDGVAAIINVLLNGRNGEAYNIANNNEFVSIYELAKKLINIYPEKNLKIIYETRLDSGYLNLSVSNQIKCDTTKVERLGCKFNVSIEDGFRRTIDYFSSLNIE